MYLDETINVDSVPDNLREIMEEVDGYYYSGDDTFFCCKRWRS